MDRANSINRTPYAGQTSPATRPSDEHLNEGGRVPRRLAQPLVAQLSFSASQNPEFERPRFRTLLGTNTPGSSLLTANSPQQQYDKKYAEWFRVTQKIAALQFSGDTTSAKYINLVDMLSIIDAEMQVLAQQIEAHNPQNQA